MRKISLIIMLALLFVVSGCENGDDFAAVKSITFHDLSLEIPKVFEFDDKNGNNDIAFYGYFNEDDKKNSCDLSLTIMEFSDEDIKESMEYAFYGNTDWSYSEKNINGNKWSVGYRKGSTTASQTVYLIRKNDKEYKLSYDDFGSGDKCEEALKNIEKSLKFK